MHTTIGKAVIGLMVGMFLCFGCAQAPLNVKPIDKTGNPAELLEKLGKELDAAKKERVNLLSPYSYAASEASYAKAKVALEKGKEASRVLAHIATGNALLAQAINITKNSNKYLTEVIKSRDAAIKAGANQYKKEFDRLESEFSRLTKAVEKGDMKYVGRKKDLTHQQYRELELRAIKDATLKKIRQLMQVAGEHEMDEIAPKSYLTAKGKHAEADSVITQSRYDKEAINKAVQAAEFYGRRLHHIASASEKVENMVPEDIIIWMEQFFAHTTGQLKAQDSRNLTFKEQQQVISKAIRSLQRNQTSTASQVQAKEMEINKLNQRIKDLESRTYEVRADQERVAAEKRFNDQYKQAQGFFTPDQAEVYKKDRNLVVRLKSMQFPVGKAVIMQSNNPLLKKVKEVIRIFGKPEVVIEGHTDSTGSADFNKELSRNRAESVQQYLIQSGVLPPDKVMARGYGASRPLASNATNQGRAINRRIDVIIKPNFR